MNTSNKNNQATFTGDFERLAATELDRVSGGLGIPPAWAGSTSKSGVTSSKVAKCVASALPQAAVGARRGGGWKGAAEWGGAGLLSCLLSR